MGKFLSHWLNLRFKYSSCLDKWSRWVFKFIKVLFVLSIFLLKRSSLVVKTSTVWERFNWVFSPSLNCYWGEHFRSGYPRITRAMGRDADTVETHFFFSKVYQIFSKMLNIDLYRETQYLLYKYQWSTNRKKVWYYTYPTAGHQMFHHWGGNDISITTGCIITLVVGYFYYWYW